MRNTFIKELMAQSRINKNIYLITSDLGFRSFEPFKKEFPDRFINVGVSENNMVGISAGMALKGKKVFVYSILPFLIFRSLEQIRNNVCHNNLDVKLIGGGGGFSYSAQGISHNTTEDLSIIRSLPNINVFNPGSNIEAELALSSTFNTKGPSFIRLGKAPSVDYLSEKPDYNIGNGLLIKDGKDLTIFCCGNITRVVVDIAKELESHKISAKIISLFCIKPINKKYIISNISSKKIVTIEEHSEVGGIGSIIADILCENRINNFILKKIALKDKCHNEIGSQDFLRKLNGLEKDQIIVKIKALLGKND